MGVDVLAIAEEASAGFAATGLAAAGQICKAGEIAVKVNRGGAGTCAATSAVLLAVAGWDCAALVAVNVAVGNGNLGTVGSGSIGFAKLLCGHITFGMAAGEAIEKVGVTGGYALGTAAVDALGFGAGGTAAGAGSFKLQGRTLRCAATLHLDLAIDALAKIEIPAVLGGCRLSSTAACEEGQRAGQK